MGHETIELDWRKLRETTGPYPPAAYMFVREGLAHTARAVYGADAEDDDGADRHVNGAQLCLGLREFAVQRYGLLARTVLSRWNIRATDDFGRIVFGLIDAGLLRKGEADRPEDFEGVYEFDEAFGRATASGELN